MQTRQRQTQNYCGSRRWASVRHFGRLLALAGILTGSAVAVGQTDPANSSVIATAGTAVADGVDFDTITVTLLDGASAPVVGNTVVLAISAATVDPTQASINPASGTSDAAGQVTFQVRSTVAQTVTYRGIDLTDGVVITAPDVVVFAANTTDAGNSTVVAASGTATADGVDTDVITVTLNNGLNNAVAGHTVTLAVSAGGVAGVTISAASGPSDENGVVTFTVSCTIAKTVTFQATDTTDAVTVTQTDNVIFTHGPTEGTHSTLTAPAGDVVADGVSTKTLTVTLLDVTDNPVNGHNIALSVVAGGAAGLGGDIAATQVSDASGVATFDITSTVAKSVTIQAEDTTDSVTIADTVSIDFISGTTDAGNSTVTAPAGNVVACGGATKTITVTLRDGANNPVTGHDVELSVSAGGAGGVTISAPSGQSNASGVVTFTVSSTIAKTITLQAEDTTNSVTITLTVNVTFVPAATSTLTSTVAPADGTAIADDSDTELITVTFEDACGNAIQGHTATLQVIAGGATNVTISAPSGPSNASGVVTFTVRSSEAKTVTFAATDTTLSSPLTDTAVVAFTAGAAAALQFVQQPANTDIGATISVTVNITDASNNLVTTAANAVTIALQSNPTGATLGGTTTVAAANGVATFNNITLNRVGAGFTLRATSAGLTGATSDAFNISAGTNLTSPVITLAEGDTTTGLTIGYSIEGAESVDPFDISYGLDRDGVLPIDIVFGTVSVTDPTELSPGTHSVDAGDIRSDLNETFRDGDELVVVLDSNDDVAEVAPGNADNEARTTLRLDFVATRFIFAGTAPGRDFRALVGYSIDLNPVSEDFTIGFYISDNSDASIGTDDVRFAVETISAAADKTQGPHSKTFTLNIPTSVPFTTSNFFLKVRLNDDNAVGESDATNNIIAAPNSSSDPNADVDGDGLTRGEEDAGFVIPAGIIFRGDETESAAIPAVDTQTFDTAADTDGDGLSDSLERDTNTIPGPEKGADTDGDGLGDGVEDANHNGIVDPNETDPRNWDTDGDGLSDAEELTGFLVTRYPGDATSGRFQRSYVTRVFTDPTKADTDGDGLSDWDEVNTYARAAEADGSVPSIGLGPMLARAGRTVTKPVFGIRTDPTKADTDDDGIPDADDPAPQINPARWGFDLDNDGTFGETDLGLLNAQLGGAGPATVAEFQTLLLNFDQDEDGFLEAPDANGDGFPDFTRYNEATLEQAFGIDFSNNGSLDDGFDVGGLNQGDAGPFDARCGSANEGQALFGTYRVMRSSAGATIGDGQLDTLDDTTGQLIPTDNCPTAFNPEQLDFDGDGLGDDCDADLDNDGVGNELDPVTQSPGSSCSNPNPLYVAQPLCAFGVIEGLVGSFIGLVGVRAVSVRRTTRRVAIGR